MEYELSVDAAWRNIRAKRHQPPGNAAKKDRRLTFAAAMKQSEQFFRLSDVAGYETKPILLYYGLNQAARAIVAVGAAPGEPWQIYKHGLTCPRLNETKKLGDIVVVDEGKGKSFQKLAEHMNSPTLPTQVKFRELWGTLPEGAEAWLQGSADLCTAVRLEVTTARRTLDQSRWLAGVKAMRLYGLPRHEYSRSGTAELTKLMHERYPSLKGLVPIPDAEGRVSTLVMLGRDRGSIGVTTEHPVGAGYMNTEVHQVLRRGLEIYHSTDDDEMATWILPTIAGNDEPLAPIVTWWAVLYVLSMLARYQPSAWTMMLDIDSSPDAPAVEYLLDEAHRACINLIVDAFKSVEERAGWQDVFEDLSEQ